MADTDPNLEELRRRIGELDRDLLELAARRLELARRIGELKEALGRPTRDFAQERVVLERAREAGREAGLPPGLAEELLLAMIRRALAVQEQQGLSHARSGQGQRALVVGGAGKMGRWFHRFLGSQGFDVSLADPEQSDADVEQFADWRDAGTDYDVVVLATPLLVANGILESMAKDPPDGLVFDIGSLKSPLRHGLTKLQATGARVTSIHPMFGPDADVLSGRHVIFVDVGHAEATRQARELFAATAVVQVEMSLDDHDRLIAYVLGLSHALNICVLHRARGERRGGRRARGSVEHDLRRSARGRESRVSGEPGSLLRDPGAQRLRGRVARGVGARRGDAGLVDSRGRPRGVRAADGARPLVPGG